MMKVSLIQSADDSVWLHVPGSVLGCGTAGSRPSGAPGPGRRHAGRERERAGRTSEDGGTRECSPGGHNLGRQRLVRWERGSRAL